MQRSFTVLSSSILWKDYPNARLVTLNRPKALNALDMEMIDSLREIYVNKPHANGSSTLYILKGAGDKSFCAGGDVVNIVKNASVGLRFFYNEYQLNHHILTMPNPQVSLWNGYVMGGGVGVSIHGKYRVTSERATLAMPETAIGLHPDVGGSWFLPRMKRAELGLYLGLTGARLKGADLVHAGLATHFVPSEEFVNLENRLCTIEDPRRIEACLDEFAVRDLPPFSLDKHRAILEKAFTLKDTTTVEGIIESLSNDNSEFAKKTLDMLDRMSPTSLKLTVETLKRGIKAKTPADAFYSEYLASVRACYSNDLHEGVRALLIDKTNNPQWQPPTIPEVTVDHVELYFEPVNPEMKQWDPTAPF